MKNIYTAFALLLFTFFYSQVPQGFSYQTIAFNASGATIANGNVALRISILDNSATGTVLYTETHNKTTNNKGLVNLNVGQGTAVTGTFSAINWGTNPKFIKVELDPAGGSNYTNVGVNQLMSVPYAQVSKTLVTGAGQGITLVSPNGTNYTLNVNDSGTLSLPTSSLTYTYPIQFFMYGNYNGWNISNSQLVTNISSTFKYAYKYFNTNDAIKIASNNIEGGKIYGVDDNNSLIENGVSYNFFSSGFYFIKFEKINNLFSINPVSITPKLSDGTYPGAKLSPKSYDPLTNKFIYELTYMSSGSQFSSFRFSFLNDNTSTELYFGDNFGDGSIDKDGTKITLPNLTSTSKNYRIEFTLNFNGSGSYNITQF